MAKSYKEQLSLLLQNCFKRYITPGVHICEFATGSGKSHTIGELTCEYYPEHFDRIIILCVQTKLVLEMENMIKGYIDSPNSLIKQSDILILKNNTETIKEAIDNGSFKLLLERMRFQIDVQKNKGSKTTDMMNYYSLAQKSFAGLSDLYVFIGTDNNKKALFSKQIEKLEADMRLYVRLYIESLKKQLERTGQKKKVDIGTINQMLPSLSLVYPQVNYKSKKVLLMTVHKAMYGVDPIIDEKITITDFSNKNKRTLFLFDESDLAANAMRDSIIDQSVDNRNNRNFAKGYSGFLQYKTLLESPEHISDAYYGKELENNIQCALKTINYNWNQRFGEIETYKNIFLDSAEKIEEFRRGVFLSGPTLKLNINKSDNKTNTFVCHKKGDRHLTLVHTDESKDALKSKYSIVADLKDFLSLAIQNTSIVKSHFREVVLSALSRSKEKYNEEIKKISNNSTDTKTYLGYPTLEREIHTLLSRFECAAESQFEQQIKDYITNQKNWIRARTDNNLKLPDYSVYSQGVQLFLEEIDQRDNQQRVWLDSRQILNTPEKIILSLTAFNDTVILSSATATCKSVVSNFDIEHLKWILGGKFHPMSYDDIKAFGYLLEHTYPQGHEIKVVPIEHFQYEDKLINHWELPEKYKTMFSPKAQSDGLAEKWFRMTLRKLVSLEKDSKRAAFELYRLFQFIEAYSFFMAHDDIHSMLFFQNPTGERNREQIHFLSSLIDGTYADNPSAFDIDSIDDLPKDYENKHIRITKDWNEVENVIIPHLSTDKNAKIMLVAAYGSFKAGTNMQYGIPEGIDYLAGDNWESDPGKLKKDWDAIYLQSPTSYLTMNDNDDDSTFDKSLHRVMLVLMMLHERGALSKKEVADWLYKALTNSFLFSDSMSPGISIDKAFWALTVIEQTIGRICRTRNKPQTTYVLYDETMEPFFRYANENKSLTIEYRTLMRYIKNRLTVDEQSILSEEIILCNNANTAQSLLDNMRRIALRYTIHDHSEIYDDDDDDTDNGVPYSVRINQIMNQSYKQTIIKKPQISSLDELTDEDKTLTFIDKCYGDWKRNSDGSYSFSYSMKDKIITTSKKGKTYSVSPKDVRLDVLMKNDVIRKHFEAHGYATNWKPDGLILHPKILRTDYAGEIGEEAFAALAFHYTNCSEKALRHLEGKDYELADYVILKEDGSYKIAFDVKNMNPKADHIDNQGDIPTTEKRARKQERLGCELITVNMIRLKDESFDLHEIDGLLDEKGNVIPESIEKLKMLIND